MLERPIIQKKKKKKKRDKPLFPVSMQSTPSLELFSLTWRDLIEANVSIGLKPEFSERARGTASRASANARMAYCSIPGLCSRLVQVDEEENQATHLNSSVFNSKRAGDFCSTSAVHNSVVAHQVADNAECIM